VKRAEREGGTKKEKEYKAATSCENETLFSKGILEIHSRWPTPDEISGGGAR